MIYLRLLRPFTCRAILNFKPVRHISQHPFKFLENQERWREKDGVPKNWQLIYKAPMENILNYAVTYLTASTAIVALTAANYAAFQFDITKINDPILLGGEVVIANNSTEFLIYVGAFVLFHVAVKVLLSKFVVRLYQNGDEYLAIFRGNWYNSIKKHKFRLEEFKKLRPTFVVTWGDARFGLGDKHGILFDKYFKTPEHFNNLVYKKHNNL